MTSLLDRILGPCRRRRRNRPPAVTSTYQPRENLVPTLLECEKKAKQKITDAQQRRKAMKDKVQTFVMKEGDTLRLENEKRMAAKEEKDRLEMLETRKRLDAEIEHKLSEIGNAVSVNKENSLVMDVQPQLHRNCVLRQKVLRPPERIANSA